MNFHELKAKYEEFHRQKTIISQLRQYSIKTKTLFEKKFLLTSRAIDLDRPEKCVAELVEKIYGDEKKNNKHINFLGQCQIFTSLLGNSSISALKPSHLCSAKQKIERVYVQMCV